MSHAQKRCLTHGAGPHSFTLFARHLPIHASPSRLECCLIPECHEAGRRVKPSLMHDLKVSPGGAVDEEATSPETAEIIMDKINRQWADIDRDFATRSLYLYFTVLQLQNHSFTIIELTT